MVHTLNHNYCHRPDLAGAPRRARARVQRAQHARDPPLAELWGKAAGDRRLVHRLERQSCPEALWEKSWDFTLIGGNKGVMTRAEILLHKSSNQRRAITAASSRIFLPGAGALLARDDGSAVFLRENAGAAARLSLDLNERPSLSIFRGSLRARCSDEGTGAGES